MTKVKTETPEQAERRRERNRQRRQAAAVAKVMERAAATNAPVEATKPATMTTGATKAPKTQPGAVEAATEATKAPMMAQRAKEIGFKMGVNGYLIDLEGVPFYPFYPDDLTSAQGMLQNDAAIRGRAVGALDQLAEFFASRVTGRAPSRTEMRLAALIESLAKELMAVADEVPAILDRLDDLRKERDQARKERDDLQEYKADLVRQFSQYHGQYVLIDIPPDEPEAKPAAKPIKERQSAPVKPAPRVDLIAG